MANIHRSALIGTLSLFFLLFLNPVSFANAYGKLSNYYIVPSEIVSPPPVSPPSGGGGGYVAPPAEETKFITVISPRETVTVKFEKSSALGVEEISIQSTNLVTNVQITVKETSKPATAPLPISPAEGAVYRYIEFKKTNIQDADISKIKMKFKVGKSWIVLNTLDPATVKLARLEGSEWKKMLTSKISEDSSYFYYESETPGFFVFTIFAKKKSEEALDIVYLPVLREVALSQATVFSVSVKNNAYTTVNGIKVNLAGIPDSWVSVEPSTVDIPTDSIKTFNIAIAVPSDTAPGDYKVILNASNGDISSEKFFILRIKPYAEERAQPIVTRIVEIDRIEEKTNVHILVNNPGTNSTNIQIIEKIDKEIARSTKDINFVTPPTEILQSDPVVMWSIFDLSAGEKTSISYSTSIILDDFTKYIYWPLEQLTIATQKFPAGYRLIDFKIPRITPGTKSTLTLIVENLDPVSHKFKFQVELPKGWTIEPKEVEETILAKERKEIKLSLFVPAETDRGNYIIRGIFYWDDNLIIREFGVNIGVFPVESILVYVLMLAVVFIAYFIIKSRKREDRSKVLKSLQRIRGGIR